MRRSREQLKATMLKEAEALIERLLDWAEAAAAPTLTEIEDEVLTLRGQMGKKMAEEVVESQEASQPAAAPSCPRCHRPMQNKGLKRALVETRLGPVEMERGYYYCPHCRRGFSPSGSAASHVQRRAK